MLIPPIFSYASGYFFVAGQMTLTFQPAPSKALASCQTRRSRGTGRFSTTMTQERKSKPQSTSIPVSREHRGHCEKGYLQP